MPDDAAEAYVADARQRLPRDGGSSTLFDLVAGQPLESAALVGAVAERASGCSCRCRRAAPAPPSWASWILPTVRFTLKR